MATLQLHLISERDGGKRLECLKGSVAAFKKGQSNFIILFFVVMSLRSYSGGGESSCCSFHWKILLVTTEQIWSDVMSPATSQIYKVHSAETLPEITKIVF